MCEFVVQRLRCRAASAGEKCDDSQRWAPSSSSSLLSLLPPPSDWEAGSQGAGAALSVNCLGLRHVTQQQSQSNNTASPGKWWQVLLKGKQRRSEWIIEAASERCSALLPAEKTGNE